MISCYSPKHGLKAHVVQHIDTFTLFGHQHTMCVLLLLWVFVVVKTHYLSRKFAIPITMLIPLVYSTYCKVCDR